MTLDLSHDTVLGFRISLDWRQKNNAGDRANVRVVVDLDCGSAYTCVQPREDLGDPSKGSKAVADLE